MARWILIAGLLGVGALPVAAQDFEALKGHGGPIMALDVTDDGRVASASFDNSVGLWSGGSPAWLEGHAAAVSAIATGPNGMLVSGGDDFSVRLWGDGGRELGRHEGKVAALAISEAGTTVASGGWDGAIWLWPLKDGDARRLVDPGAGVNDLAFAEDGLALYAATSSGQILRYDLAQNAPPIVLVEHGFGINELVIGPGWIAYGAVDGGTRVIALPTGAPLADFTLDRRPILAMDYHPGTDRIAVGDGQGYLMVLDSANWRIVSDTRVTREGPVWALAFGVRGEIIHAGGLDDVIYAWPVDLLDAFEGQMGRTTRAFLRDPASMPNGERQFMRKCSICHALDAGPSRKAGPTLHGIFGRKAGAVPGYAYSDRLKTAPIVWDDESIDALFDQGPDDYIPGSKMPMQVIAAPEDRADLIAFLRRATGAAD